MTRLDLSSILAKSAADHGALNPGILTVFAVMLLIFGLSAVRRAVQPVREILAAVAAASAALLLVLAALVILIVALGMHVM